jgi:hypothetical protein
MVIVLSFGLVVIDIVRPGSLAIAACPLTCLNLYFSNASEQLDKSSLTKTSLSVYIDLATISNSFLVSALNYFFSVSDIIGSFSCS